MKEHEHTIIVIQIEEEIENYKDAIKQLKQELKEHWKVIPDED